MHASISGRLPIDPFFRYVALSFDTESGAAMLICPTTRTKLLSFLPEGGEVAEIGVANGDFSQDILAQTHPRRLHLIDPWERQDREDYADDPSNVSKPEQDHRFNAVLARFLEQIDGGIVKVHREYSAHAAKFFADGQLDWIYIDGMHTAEAAYADLVTYARKIRDDGFIIGHDYTNHVQAQEWNFGVVAAVNRFVLEFDYEFVVLTVEAFPTYVLARDRIMARRLTDALVRSVPYVLEIRDFPRRNEFQHKSLSSPKGTLVYPSF